MGSGIRVSGMVSGLDTESIVSALVMNQVEKKNKISKAKTKLEWKEEAYKSINTKVYSLYNKVSNMRFSSAYNLRKTTVSDPTKASVTASSSAINGTQTLQINKLAKAGYLTGGKFASGTTGSTTLSSLGYRGGSSNITVRVGDSVKNIEVSGSTTLDELVSSLNDAGVKASYDATNLRMFVSAKDTGTENDFSLTADSVSGLQVLAAVGLNTQSSADALAYQTTAAYAAKAIDADGNVTSLFQLNDDGTIKYDANGNALLNGTISDFSEEATKASIKNILSALDDAYDENAALASEKSTLNARLKYSKSKDAVEDFQSEHEDQSEKAELLIKLLSYGDSQYAYVDENNEIHTSSSGEAGWTKLTDKAKELARDLGLITTEDGVDNQEKLDELYANIKNIKAIDESTEMTDAQKEAYRLQKKLGSDTEYIAKDSDGNVLEDANGNALTVEERLAEIDAKTEANNAIISANSYWNVGGFTDESFDVDSEAAKIVEKIKTAANIVAKTEGYTVAASEGAVRVDAADAEIVLNGATFTSSSNTFDINGLSIKATAVTAAGEELTLSTDVDTDSIYDSIKDFFKEYNEVINELSKLYNADSAKDYEPLTDDEKEEMSDKEIEQWEEKIKDALLRRDSTIGGIINVMTSSMTKAYEINGKSYSLGSFGITTQGYLNASKNEQYAFHIAGDADDDVSKGKDDKLKYAIQNNPDDVIDFMKKLTTGLYSELDKKMKGTSLKSSYTIYNDKQITKDLASYKKQISTWEDKIADLEDRYYKQFSAMEKQLAQMQSSTSALSSLMGTS